MIFVAGWLHTELEISVDLRLKESQINLKALRQQITKED